MKNLLLISSILLLSGCVQKNADNSYSSQYSYHSYNQTNRYSDNSPLSKQIERTAKSHLGKTYKWGANGPYNFDCSGFTESVFNQHGIKIPRVSRDQAKVGKIVPWNYLEKGDLVFFDSKKSSRVSHVGIYLGEGKFIHASSSQHRVVISNLESNYYAKHFKWGRRVGNTKVYASR
jgi:cell wall-associated NlpC family hydrolase